MPRQMWVSDEVWAQLDPSLVRLPRRTRVKVTAWCVAAAVVLALVLLGTASGLFVPRLTVGDGSFSGSGHTCSQSLSINNHGWFDESVESTTLRANGTGATLTQGVAGQTIPSGGSQTVRIRFTGAICDRLATSPLFQNGSRTPPDLVLHLHRPWGSTTDVLALAPPPDRNGLDIQL